MGLKHIETVKSIILLLLIALSITFTFSIWTYSPRYETMDQSPTTDNIAIANKESIDQIIKPYKTVFNFNDSLRGTVNAKEIDMIIDEISDWKITDISLVNQNFGAEEWGALLRKPNRFTLYYHGEVPLTLYDTVLYMDEKMLNVPEISFDRLVIDWNASHTYLDILFISKMNKTMYSAKAQVRDYKEFERTILTMGQEFEEYGEVNPGGSPYIVVPTGTVEARKNTYFQEEVRPSQFRNALFSDPSAVRRSQLSSYVEDYGDNQALMKVYTDKKKLEFMYLFEEPNELAIPSELLEKAIYYVNEHSGWTDEYRYTYMDPASSTVRFRLFLHGLPVYTDSSLTTEIVQKWGKNGITDYSRPYYTRGTTLESKVQQLPSGMEVAERLKESDMIDLDKVEELTVGYFMKYDMKQGLLIMEPAWFYLSKGNWNRFLPETSGGELIGLE
ncbi:YycH family regulatory protein [Sporosarcina soli]|uniref:YycH family regulatory protein n=1 Tax=Sporosarcina soli TaxID=334736 RepID=A0ABW0TME8_9BACL